MASSSNYIASIVIPAHGRNHLVERAYASVLACNGSNLAEVIIIDDFSTPPLVIKSLREQDTIVRTDRQIGAAVGRNIGIKMAQGDFLYLLDSDDYFIERDFLDDHVTLDRGALSYCSIAPSKTAFPLELETSTLLSDLLFRIPHLCQTSSLVFHRSVPLRFDEDLPKHQDWDFVLSASKSGIPLRKCRGLVHFDTSDKNSLSRRYQPDRSRPWLRKILADNTVSTIDKDMLEFHILAKYPQEMSWTRLFFSGTRLIFRRRTNLRFLARTVAHRLIQLTRSTFS